MDREKIERRDFPTGRRGYDPAAVDEHLRRVADEFEAHAHAPAPSLSSDASEQVRHILVAAERSAAELRARAGEEASEHVARVQAAAGGMLAQLGDLERELGGLLETLRAAGERLTTGLAALQAEVGGVDAVAVAAAVELAAEPEPAPAAAPEREPAPAPEREPAPAPASAEQAAPDDAGARMVALNMALSGSTREDTARYLVEQFALADPAALLDDVYARAGR